MVRARSAVRLRKLVELPDEFARVGAWLSTPKGRPTPLACAAYAVLVGWPLWLALIGCLVYAGCAWDSRGISREVSYIRVRYCTSASELL